MGDGEKLGQVDDALISRCFSLHEVLRWKPVPSVVARLAVERLGKREKRLLPKLDDDAGGLFPSSSMPDDLAAPNLRPLALARLYRLDQLERPARFALRRGVRREKEME